jgi:hypothetical protein
LRPLAARITACKTIEALRIIEDETLTLCKRITSPGDIAEFERAEQIRLDKIQRKAEAERARIAENNRQFAAERAQREARNQQRRAAANQFRQRQVQAGDQHECSICLEPMHNHAADAEEHILPCGHKFHKPCIANWLDVRQNCPMCRAPCARINPPNIQQQQLNDELDQVLVEINQIDNIRNLFDARIQIGRLYQAIGNRLRDLGQVFHIHVM